MNYQISFGSYTGVFAVPTAAADQYINEADQNDLKVLLYLFRHSGEELCAEPVCKALCLTDAQLKASLDFWSGRGLIGFTPTAVSA